jgi:peptidoglycan/xylan/chitin deacetylase (PgdA/CDA1 family)
MRRLRSRILFASLTLALAACTGRPPLTPGLMPVRPAEVTEAAPLMASLLAPSATHATPTELALKPAALDLTPAPSASPVASAAPTERPTQPAPPSPTSRLARRVPILEYHYSTFAMTPDVQMQTQWFLDQMAWLAANDYVTLSSQQLADFVAGRWAPPARAVALTFDVGASHFDDYRTVIVPALRQYGFQAIFFVMPSQTRAECDGPLTCWPQLLAWRDEGLIAIESHSLTHYDYATLPPERLALDIAGSKRAIEAVTGVPVLGLCYPFDSLSAAAPALLAQAGYAYAVAGDTRFDRSAEFADPTPFSLPRYYPYSGVDFYPQLGGRRGPTFAEMLLAAGADSATP